MKEGKKTIICYLDRDRGRDVEILLPVAYTMERYFDCEVIYAFIWDMYLMRRLKPYGVLLPNAKGHHMYFEIAKYAYKNHIQVFALESEGHFRTDGTFPYWGYNTDHFFYQEWVTCWSDRTRQFIRSIARNEQKNKIVLTGGVGFDRYPICNFEPRKKFLARFNKEKYQRIIGYAGWGFGKIYSAHKNIAHTHIFPEDKNKRWQWIEGQRKHVRDALRFVIEHNPETLFIFKRHPKESFESDTYEGPNEMNELLDYENVLYFRQEEDIHNLINVSHLWLGFETTTTLEAWLMGKTTILINSEEDFPRNNLHLGSPKVKTADELQRCILEYFETGTLKDFEDDHLKAARHKLVSDTIGYSDGLNHLRAVYYFSKSLNKPHSTRTPKLNLRHLRLYYLMHWGKYFYRKAIFEKLPYFRKTIYVFESMNLDDLESRKDEYYESLDRFYAEKNIDKAIRNEDWSQIFPLDFTQ